MQGLRLATSSEYDSDGGVGESGENIKLRQISKHYNKSSIGHVNICSDQENDPVME